MLEINSQISRPRIYLLYFGKKFLLIHQAQGHLTDCYQSDDTRFRTDSNQSEKWNPEHIYHAKIIFATFFKFYVNLSFE